MKIGILGQPCIDEVVAPSGELRHQALGGILYSYAGMERLMANGEASDTFVGVSYLPERDKTLIEPLLDRMPHLSSNAGLWLKDTTANRVRLVYSSDATRSEHCFSMLPPLTSREVTTQLLESLDALFLNMISGTDVELETLEAALKACRRRPFLHLDVHCLILPNYKYGDSAIGPVKNWHRWLKAVDSVQMNDREARWFADPDLRSEQELVDWLKQEPTPRPCYLTITRAGEGATLYDLERGERHDVKPKEREILDPTGCGDVFGSALLYSLMKDVSPSDALERAVEFATWNASLPNLEALLEE